MQEGFQEWFDRVVTPATIYKELMSRDPTAAALLMKAQSEYEKEKERENVKNEVSGLYLLFQPGKRTGIPALVIGKNPDGSVNLVASENGTALGFFLGVPTKGPYDAYNASSFNDATKPFAKLATSVE